MKNLPSNFNLIGCRASEKLDGIRVHFDGRHLITRTGNRLNAPQWFLDKIKRPAVGELWAGRDKFQLLQSIVTKQNPNDRWQQVQFIPFESIPSVKIKSVDHFKTLYQSVLDRHGEGLVITAADGTQYKKKPIDDDDGILIEHIQGNGKYTGMVNGFRLQLRSGDKLKISAGMTDRWRTDPPDIGSIVCFQYNGLTKKGLPRHARIKGIRAEHSLNF